MVADLVRALYPEVEEPLPRVWAENILPGIDVSEDCVTALYTHRSRSDDHCVIADYPVPVACGVYYFEVRIIAPPLRVKKHCLGVGFRDAEDWFGYGFSGKLFEWGDVVDKFKHGDVVGSGYSFKASRCFFTLNGRVVASKPHHASDKIYPIMILSSKKVEDPIGGEANFGQRPFVFEEFSPENQANLVSFGG